MSFKIFSLTFDVLQDSHFTKSSQRLVKETTAVNGYFMVHVRVAKTPLKVI